MDLRAHRHAGRLHCDASPHGNALRSPGAAARCGRGHLGPGYGRRLCARRAPARAQSPRRGRTGRRQLLHRLPDHQRACQRHNRHAGLLVSPRHAGHGRRLPARPAPPANRLRLHRHPDESAGGRRY
ncbi:MAG: hypothetical protein CVU38_17060, partial [Chloroflexi bacterium HGW-Chloroflexi-1]